MPQNQSCCSIRILQRSIPNVGTERIISYLTEELVRFGHKVTLFASGDSVTSADLVPVCRRSFRQNKRATDYLSREVLLMDHVWSGPLDSMSFIFIPVACIISFVAICPCHT